MREGRLVLTTIAALLLAIWAGLPSLHATDTTRGERLYQSECAACHHPQRIGQTAPPLLPPFLQKISDGQLKETIRRGLPSTPMPAFSKLGDEEIDAIIAYLRSPASVSWSEEQASSSVQWAPPPAQTAPISQLENVTAVVERGRQSVWMMEDRKVLDRFSFGNVHGGIKFAPDQRQFFVPARDGWIARYDIGRGYAGKFRGCVYLRNIAVSRDGTRLALACWLPSRLVVVDSQSFKPVWSLDVKGKLSGIYSLEAQNAMVWSYRDLPELGILDLDTLKVRNVPLQEPLEDFFIDPFERNLIGSSRSGTLLTVFDLEQFRPIYSQPVQGMPHLASAAVWYAGGQFYFATAHIQRSVISVWQMYDWKLLDTIDIGGTGSFVRTHRSTPYLWTDDGTDALVLIDKRTHSVRRLTPMPGKKVTHTEFSGDGNLAYVSVQEVDGALLIYDARTLELLEKLPASIPVGKYNFVQKQHRFEPAELGQAVFMEKCWGCHHPEQRAFGPAFQWVAKTRTDEQIVAQILDPARTAPTLGYAQSAMPKLPVNDVELEALMAFIQQLRVKTSAAAPTKSIDAPAQPGQPASAPSAAPRAHTAHLRWVDHSGFDRLVTPEAVASALSATDFVRDPASGKPVGPVDLYNMAEHSLEHARRQAGSCKDFLSWQGLGFSAVTEPQRQLERHYRAWCHPLYFAEGVLASPPSASPQGSSELTDGMVRALPACLVSTKENGTLGELVDAGAFRMRRPSAREALFEPAGAGEGQRLELVASGDFDHDGQADVLLRRWPDAQMAILEPSSQARKPRIIASTIAGCGEK